MGVFQKVGGWLANKSDQFIRGDVERERGYYATREARDAYSSMGSEQEMSDAAGEQSERRSALDPFGRGEGDYGGRVPYRSKYDIEMEAYQKAQQQAAMQQSTRMNAVPPQAASQNPQTMPPRAGQPQGMPQQIQQQVPPRQPMAAQPTYPQGFGTQANNVVPFPGMQRSPEGLVYAHVEYIVLLRSRNECKDVIGYIKTNASVFLNMEFIASDSERQRCVDMLSGAAYTLGCALNKISPRGIYLISAPTVKVVLDPAMQKISASREAQGFTRQRYEHESYPQQPQAEYAQQPTQTPVQGYEQPVQAPMSGYEQSPQFVGGFNTESPTARFQAQGTQRNRPATFSSAMAGNRSGSYPRVDAMASGQNRTDRYPAVDYPQ